MACPICNRKETNVKLLELHVNTCLDRNDPILKVEKAEESVPSPRGSDPDPDPIEDSPEESALDIKHNNSDAKQPPRRRTCPFYKIIPDTGMAVDAFSYGPVPSIELYLLTHFHSDHYMGLSKKFNYGTILCSRVTANLVRSQLGVDKRYIVELDLDKVYWFQGLGGLTISVELIDAFHCPGAAIALVKFGSTTVLHTGDFRAQQFHLEHPSIAPLIGRIDTLYLDTTYLKPQHVFPSQESIIKATVELCLQVTENADHKSLDWIAEETGFKRVQSGSRNKMIKLDPKQPSILSWISRGAGAAQPASRGGGSTSQKDTEPPTPPPLIVVGSYLIGKEKIYKAIARALNTKLYCDARKLTILSHLHDPELLALITRDPSAARVHITSMDVLRHDRLEEYRATHAPNTPCVLGFRPTGWSFEKAASCATLLGRPSLSKDARVAVVSVPYSEHSSFNELKQFVSGLRPRKVIPTVNVHSAASRAEMAAHLESWMRGDAKLE
ncbi:hypothetical protein HDU96_003352 [Phlyctochytrium bullatum]|nr:hypothetical protein HDU96_003352 [Phlyctochytrium bullatum]